MNMPIIMPEKSSDLGYKDPGGKSERWQVAGLLLATCHLLLLTKSYSDAPLITNSTNVCNILSKTESLATS